MSEAQPTADRQETRDEAVRRIMREMIVAGKDLTRKKFPELPALNAKLDELDSKGEFKPVSADERNRIMTAFKAEDGDQDDGNETGSSPNPVAIPPDVPPETLEAAVQMAALLYRREGADPSGEYLLHKCGQIHVDAVKKMGANPKEVATWACAEARRRSPAMDHKAIVAQRIA